MNEMEKVFPASAGVIPIGMPTGTAVSSFPRIRGGDPMSALCRLPVTMFSPHPRG